MVAGLPEHLSAVVMLEHLGRGSRKQRAERLRLRGRLRTTKARLAAEL